MAGPGPRASLALLGAAALLLGGCGVAHRCALPDPPLGQPPGPPIPARVGLSTPEGLAGQRLEPVVGETSWSFPVGWAAVSAFHEASRQLFAEIVPAGGSAAIGPEAVLEWSVAGVRLWPGPFRPERAEVEVTAVLRDGGGEVARARAVGQGEGQPMRWLGTYHCDSGGEALAAAIGQATSQVRDQLGASPEVAAWVRAPARHAAPAAAPPDQPLPAAAQPASASVQPAQALPAPERPSAGTRWFRSAFVPRYLELDLVHGTAWSAAPGIGRIDGAGWGVRLGWDVGESFAWGLHAASTRTRVGWTPDPAQATDGAENGFVGLELLWRFRQGARVRPWVSATGAYQGVLWDTYLYSVAGWSLLASAGVDLQVVPWGAVRLGVSGSAYSATTSSSVGGPSPPGPGEDGWTTGVRSLWLTAGWFFDLGPAR